MPPAMEQARSADTVEGEEPMGGAATAILAERQPYGEADRATHAQRDAELMANAAAVAAANSGEFSFFLKIFQIIK